MPLFFVLIPPLSIRPMIHRRDFLKYSAAILGTAAVVPALRGSSASETAASDFTLWQLPLLESPIQGNSYVFRMSSGKVVVMDGGVPQEAGYLRGFLGALGNEVDTWFVSHPHGDHIGALNAILKKPNGITIKKIYHSEFSKDFYENVETGCRESTADFYDNLKKTDAEVVDVTEPGLLLEIDNTKFKILDIKDERVRINPYNNSCMVIRCWDATRSFVFLGDAGREQGDRLLAGPFRRELDCDFLQLAHHGQKGVSKDFYRTIKFDTCLWPTPLWLYNNDAGKGYNTHDWETVEIRELMQQLGIKKHFLAFEGLRVVE